MGTEALDEHARWIRAAPRDHRGRIEVVESATGKTLVRLPIDALDGARRGLYARPGAAVASAPEPTVQERIQAGAKR